MTGRFQNLVFVSADKNAIDRPGGVGRPGMRQLQKENGRVRKKSAPSRLVVQFVNRRRSNGSFSLSTCARASRYPGRRRM